MTEEKSGESTEGGNDEYEPQEEAAGSRADEEKSEVNSRDEVRDVEKNDPYKFAST